MEWCKDDVLTLIQMYKDRENLWNCATNEYRNKNNRHDALTEIADHFETTKFEVERKLKNILSTFAREHKKTVTKKSGSGSDDVVTTKWFAYQSLLFLKDRNKVKGTLDSEVCNYLLSFVKYSTYICVP